MLISKRLPRIIISLPHMITVTCKLTIFFNFLRNITHQSVIIYSFITNVATNYPNNADKY